MDDIVRSLENEIQGQQDEELDDEEFDERGKRSDNHSNSRREVPVPQRGRLKRQNSSIYVPLMEETMAAYFDFKKEQAIVKEQGSKQGNEYSISRCFKVLQKMDEVSDEIMIFASDVFKDATNREFFLCYEPRLRGLWMKKEVEKLGN